VLGIFFETSIKNRKQKKNLLPHYTLFFYASVLSSKFLTAFSAQHFSVSLVAWPRMGLASTSAIPNLLRMGTLAGGVDWGAF
jgi:hypothetical protein